jgi:hypothetical protein
MLETMGENQQIFSQFFSHIENSLIYQLTLETIRDALTD